MWGIGFRVGSARRERRDDIGMMSSGTIKEGSSQDAAGIAWGCCGIIYCVRDEVPAEDFFVVVGV